MRYLVDTCILIDHLRGHEVASRFLVSAQGSAISHVTWMEIMVGAHDVHEQTALRTLLSEFDLLPLDDRVGEEAVSLRRTRRLKLPDAIILATARVHHLTLATRNTKDFQADEPGVTVPYRLP